jgi:hypothetical protein
VCFRGELFAGFERCQLSGQAAQFRGGRGGGCSARTGIPLPERDGDDYGESSDE